MHPCYDYSLDGCTGDHGGVIVALNVDTEENCHALCAFVFPNECQFYSFHKHPTHELNCNIYRTPFQSYINHCKERGGPLRHGQSFPCLTPTENTCEIKQNEKCYYRGTIFESKLDAPNETVCALACEINFKQFKLSGKGAECRYWKFDKERSTCELFDSNEKDCSIVLHNSKAENLRNPPKVINKPNNNNNEDHNINRLFLLPTIFGLWGCIRKILYPSYTFFYQLESNDAEM